MLLIIPALEIRLGRCVQPVQGLSGHVYSDDPVEMARLWRTENAKSLHVTDLDGLSSGSLPNAEVIGRLIASIDIPVEIGGALASYDVIRQAFGLGAYRVVVGADALDRPEEARRWLTDFGASKIVLGIDAMRGAVVRTGSPGAAPETPVECALRARALGFRRLLYTEVRADSTMRGLNLEGLRVICEQTGLRVTQSGGVTNLQELLSLQELEKAGVDSVVMGRALCENRFACQELWRVCEAGNYPYTAKV